MNGLIDGHTEHCLIVFGKNVVWGWSFILLAAIVPSLPVENIFTPQKFNDQLLPAARRHSVLF